MKRVLTAAVLAPLVLLAVFRAPLWLFAVLVAAVMLLALHEYLSIAEATGFKPFKWLTYLLALAPFALVWINGWPREGVSYDFPFAFNIVIFWSVVAIAGAFVLGAALVFRKDLSMGLASVATSFLGVIYIGVSLSLFVGLRADTKILVVFVLFSVWAGDIAAYYVGRSFGKHKLAPVVSPNKSWEGAIASVVASVAMAALVFHFQHQINQLLRDVYHVHQWNFSFDPSVWEHPLRHWWLHVLGLGIVTNVAAQFGDLFESALKRGANLKDSGVLLPGHGGVLDRIDALLFAVPAVWYYATLTNVLTDPPFK